MHEIHYNSCRESIKVQLYCKEICCTLENMLSHGVTSSQETHVSVHGCVYSYRYMIIYYPMFDYYMVLILQKWHILCTGAFHSFEVGS